MAPTLEVIVSLQNQPKFNIFKQVNSTNNFTVYVDANENCNEMAFQLGSSTTAIERSWKIKVNISDFNVRLYLDYLPFLLYWQVSQIECNSPNVAPDGCTQYFTSETNAVESYNYNNGNGYQLANQNQKICVR